MTERYWESTAGGAGRRAPRADVTSDARVVSLNGRWRFRLAPTAAGTGDAFIADDFDASDWDDMAVPSHWVLEPFTPLAGGPARRMLGTAEGPLYTNTAYPIPLDPPHVSEENPTGDYRVTFDAPEGWDAAVLRFQGVDSCAKVWLNGEELGWSSGSRLQFEFDVTLRPGRNVLAVRVHRWSSGTYLEDQDMWWLPGIFRDVELLERPVGGIDDHAVHADWNPATGEGVLRIDVRNGGDATVSIPELGIDVRAGETVRLPVEPWSADVPRLYRGTLSTAVETVDLAIGFRRVEIVDGVFTVNGRPVTFRGVNRHEHHPRTGRTLDAATMREDVLMMKRANIDAVRTSHYPPHPEFLRICDELGMWVVEELDLETHGFIYEGWQTNPPAVEAWRPAIMDRLVRMVERDKNHPSIVVWSLANESGSGDTFGVMRAWLDEHDPTRPVLYERDPSYRDSDFYSLMYPSLEDLDRIGRREETAPDGITAAEDERRRSLPFLLVEYAHAMGNGPGSLQDYWRIMAAHDRLCGGFVWEWMDHGFDAITDDGTPFIMHGMDVDYEPAGGRFSLHGLVFSDRTPTPGVIELAKAYAPIRIDVADDVTVHNDRHTADLGDLAFRWRVEADGSVLADGVLDVGALAAGSSVALPSPTLPAIPTDALVVLTVEAVTRSATPWAAVGHVVAWGQRVLGEPSQVIAPPLVGAPTSDGTGPLRLGPADFIDGRLVAIGGIPVDGPEIDVHRAPTENDHGQGSLNDIASVWAGTGLDRMLHRTDLVEAGDGWLRVTGRTAPTAHPHGVAWTMLWRADGDGVVLTCEADFVGPWADTPYLHRDIWVPRIGVRFAVPAEYQRATWLGRGPGESYVDTYEGAQLGAHDADIDALQVQYPVPQENGNHVETRRLRLSGPDLPTLVVDGGPVFDFTARRWTSVDLQRADKPHDLRDSGRVWLNIDHRQQGIGSASVGPALPEQYRVPRERTTWTVRFSVG